MSQSVGLTRVFENIILQMEGSLPFIIGGAFFIGACLALLFVSMFKQRGEPGGDQQVKVGALVITFLAAGLFLGGSYWIYAGQETLQNKSSEQIGQDNLKRMKDKL